MTKRLSNTAGLDHMRIDDIIIVEKVTLYSRAQQSCLVRDVEENLDPYFSVGLSSSAAASAVFFAFSDRPLSAAIFTGAAVLFGLLAMKLGR